MKGSGTNALTAYSMSAFRSLSATIRRLSLGTRAKLETGLNAGKDGVGQGMDSGLGFRRRAGRLGGL